MECIVYLCHKVFARAMDYFALETEFLHIPADGVGIVFPTAKPSIVQLVHDVACRHPPQGPQAVPASGRLPEWPHPDRPTPDRPRLAPHLLGTLRHPKALHQDWVLQMTTIPETRHESRGYFYTKSPLCVTFPLIAYNVLEAYRFL